jgi:lysophospholipase L1-like esterase
LLRAASWGSAINLPQPRFFVPDANSGFYEPFFDGAVFVGDSVTMGLRNYVLQIRGRGGSALGAARFLTSGSYGIRASSSDNYRANEVNLSWQGVNMPIEECLYAMGAKELYIMLGMNDLVGRDLPYFRDLYKKTLDKVAARNPGIVIRVQSCTPVTKSREGQVLNNTNLDAFNELLLEMCEEFGFDYIDVASPMKRDDGSFKPEYSSDNYVHMSAAGSASWINSLLSFARQKYIDGEWISTDNPGNFPGVWMN